MKSYQSTRQWTLPEGYKYLSPWTNAVLLRFLIRKFTETLPRQEHRTKTQLANNPTPDVTTPDVDGLTSGVKATSGVEATTTEATTEQTATTTETATTTITTKPPTATPTPSPTSTEPTLPQATTTQATSTQATTTTQ